MMALTSGKKVCDFDILHECDKRTDRQKGRRTELQYHVAHFAISSRGTMRFKHYRSETCSRIRGLICVGSCY